MLNRLLMGAAGLVAGALVATPAVLGLSGNSSFRRDIQVPIPSGAHSVSFATPTPSSSSDDRPGHDILSSDVPDDHGGLRGSDDNSSAGRGGHDDGPLHDIGDDHGAGRGGEDSSSSGSRGDNSGGSGGSDDSGHGGHG